MSRRTFPRFSAAGWLAAALAAAAVAQESRPIPRPDVAPMPRAKVSRSVAEIMDGVTHRSGFIAVEPVTPVQQSDASQVFSFWLGLLGGDWTPPAPAIMPPIARTSPADPDAPRPVSGWVSVPPCCAAACDGKLSGTFYREAPGCVVAVTFRGDELKVVVTMNEGGTLASCTLTADYAVTKDGTVHGVITGADVDVTSGEAKGMDLAAASLEMQAFIDQPFAFRARPTDGGLMLSNLRVANLPCGHDTPMPLGKFKAAGAGPVPAPKGLGILLNVYSSDPNLRMTLPGPRYLDHQPLYCPPDAISPVVPAAASERVVLPNPPTCVTGAPAPPAACPTPARTGCSAPPPGVADLMFQAFGEMLGAPVPVCPGPACPAPPVAVCPHPNPIPLAYAPVPGGCGMPCAPPVTLVLPTPPPVMPTTVPTGAWCRVVGPLAYTLTFENGHLTMTAALVAQDGDETGASGLVLTADYYVTRDGSGVVGIFTGADALVEGKAGEEADPEHVLKALPKLQRTLTDKPFAFTFRVHGDTLVVGNLRLPCLEEAGEMAEGLDAIAGRYRSAAGGAPRVKPVKVGPRRNPAAELPPPMPVPTYGAGPVPVGAYGPPVAYEAPLPPQALPVLPQSCLPQPRKASACPASDTPACEPADRPAKPQKMTLKDIVALSVAGLSDEVVVNQLLATGSTFTLTVADLKYLKENGVSNGVIVEMQNLRPDGQKFYRGAPLTPGGF